MAELRMYLAEKLLNCIFNIAPHNKEGKFLKIYISRYAKEKLKKFVKVN